MLANCLHSALDAQSIAELVTEARSTGAELRGRRAARRASHDQSLVNLLVDGFREAASTYVLATNFGIRRNTVRAILRRAGIDSAVNANSRSLSASEERDLFRRARDGAS